MIELEYACDACSTRIADGEGTIRLSFVALNEYRRVTAAENRDEGTAPGFDIVSFLSRPGLVPWRILHTVCRPEGDDGYEIDVELVRTWRDLVKWTAHLMEKNWLPSTDWRVVLGNAAAARDRRTVGETDALAWHNDVGDLDFTDASEAVSRHFRESTEWLMAAHLRVIVKRIRAERLDGFQYVPVTGDHDPKVYLAARRDQLAAVASGRREAAPTLPTGPRRDVAEILAGAFPAVPKGRPR